MATTTTYLNWKTAITSGNIGSTANWSPAVSAIGSDDALVLAGTSSSEAIGVYGSVSAEDLDIENADVTVTSSLTTDLSSADDWIEIGSGSTVTVNVDAAWTAPASITLGQDSGTSATLNINAGGSVSADAIYVGAAWQSPGAVANMTVQNGGKITVTDVAWSTEIGIGQGATGTLTVTGSGSSFDAMPTGWTQTQNDDWFEVGDNGTGTLNIENDATFTAGNFEVDVSY